MTELELYKKALELAVDEIYDKFLNDENEIPIEYYGWNCHACWRDYFLEEAKKQLGEEEK